MATDGMISKYEYSKYANISIYSAIRNLKFAENRNLGA